MRSEFNEAFKEHRQEGKSYSAEYKLGALWAWNHQQSKVDELQKQKSLQELEINQIAHANQQWQLKCGELQKRVDAAIYLLPSIKAENDLWGCDQVERQIELLEQALKGDQ